MAEKRMFTKKITDGDVFTSMPPTTQCLYFHLCMGADDDGFSNNIRIAMFNAHATTDDFNTLVSKRFIIPFESGVIVIKHWKMHNVIRSDRYHETKFIDERARLLLKENGVYSLNNTNGIPSDNQMTTNGIPNGYQMDTEIRLDKNSIDNNNIYGDSDESADSNSCDFEEFFNSVWKLYPKKKGKGSVSKSKKKVLQRIGYDQLKRCINRYLEYFNKNYTDKQYMMHGSRFFNSGYVDYLDENWEQDISKQEPLPFEPTEVEEEMSDEEWEEMMRGE